MKNAAVDVVPNSNPSLMAPSSVVRPTADASCEAKEKQVLSLALERDTRSRSDTTDKDKALRSLDDTGSLHYHEHGGDASDSGSEREAAEQSTMSADSDWKRHADNPITESMAFETTGGAPITTTAASSTPTAVTKRAETVSALTRGRRKGSYVRNLIVEEEAMEKKVNGAEEQVSLWLCPSKRTHREDRASTGKSTLRDILERNIAQRFEKCSVTPTGGNDLLPTQWLSQAACGHNAWTRARVWLTSSRVSSLLKSAWKFSSSKPASPSCCTPW